MSVTHNCENPTCGGPKKGPRSYELSSPFPIYWNFCDSCRSFVIGEITAKLEDKRDEAKILYNRLLEQHPILGNLMGKFYYNRFGGKLCVVEGEKDQLETQEEAD
jgi:hypothetical protein